MLYSGDTFFWCKVCKIEKFVDKNSGINACIASQGRQNGDYYEAKNYCYFFDQCIADCQYRMSEKRNDKIRDYNRN